MKDLSDQNVEVIIRFMPLPRVETMDIREQFYRLGIPVDMTLMFYDPNLPQQPNARKLRSAFPKMKICLCGDDSHLQDALGIHGELPPSQWKLRHAIADDFIVNVCLLNIIILPIFESRNEIGTKGSNNIVLGWSLPCPYFPLHQNTPPLYSISLHK